MYKRIKHVKKKTTFVTVKTENNHVMLRRIYGQNKFNILREKKRKG